VAYSHKNSRGITYWLHTREGKGGARLFFFSKDQNDSTDLPEGMEVFENPRNSLPMVRRKK